MKNPRTLLRWLLLAFVVLFYLAFDQAIVSPWFDVLVPIAALAYAGVLAAVVLRRRGRSVPAAEARS